MSDKNCLSADLGEDEILHPKNLSDYKAHQLAGSLSDYKQNAP